MSRKNSPANKKKRRQSREYKKKKREESLEKALEQITAMNKKRQDLLIFLAEKGLLGKRK